jgi:hypothetical protein
VKLSLAATAHGIDPLGIVFLLVREGFEAIRGEEHG